MSLQQPPLLDIKMDYDSEYLNLLCELEESNQNIKDNEIEKNENIKDNKTNENFSFESFIKTRIDARNFLLKYQHELHDDILEKNDHNAWIMYLNKKFENGLLDECDYNAWISYQESKKN